MTKFWPAVLVFLLWSFFAIIVHEFASNSIFGDCAISHYQQNVKQGLKASTSKGAVQPNNENKIKPFEIKNADGETIFNFTKGFITNSQNGNVKIPEDIASFKDSVYDYLNKNQEKKLHIIGKYLSSEVNLKEGTNFANSRIQHIKNILIVAGVNPDRVIPKIKVSRYEYDENGEYNNGISFEFQNINDENLAKIEEGISNKTLYSNFAVKEFKPDRKLESYTIELKNYLQKYPNKKVYIVGHTDSVGVNNDQFGLDRANNVKDYLITQGISEAILQVSSKGENKPIATNKTEEGRAKNRRIEITIK
jgi:outer membrane protein OmpA-like peptidoglycan-associated protein